MTLSLSIKERILLKYLFNEKDSFINQLTFKSILNKIDITEIDINYYNIRNTEYISWEIPIPENILEKKFLNSNDIKMFNVKYNPPDQLIWDKEKEVKNFEFNPQETKLLQNIFKNLNKSKSITLENLELCSKILKGN